MAYLFFGLGLERPQKLNDLFSSMLNKELRPVPRRVVRPEKKETPMEELPQLRPWLTWTELVDEPRDTPGKRQQLVDLIAQRPKSIPDTKGGTSICSDATRLSCPEPSPAASFDPCETHQNRERQLRPNP
jgi:hypothetical protein